MQFSAGRLFPALRTVKSDLRALMKEDLLESNWFLRTNAWTTTSLQELVHMKVTDKLLSDSASVHQ